MKTTISSMQPIGDAATDLRMLVGGDMNHMTALGILQEAVVRGTCVREELCVTLGRDDIVFTVVHGED